MSDAENLVLVVHSVDAEGPLRESLSASFERLEEVCGIGGLPRTRQTLERLKRGEIDLGGREQEVVRLLGGHRLNYNDTWDKVEAMLDRIQAPEFRRRLPDSFGGGWVYSWHCIDHVGFEINPRRRDLGYHNIFDFYAERLVADPGSGDQLQFHFHPVSTYREAHRCATSFTNSPELHQILCRRIIEREWFPSVFRAGFQTERPDSHWFLEQWIPYDLSNMAMEDAATANETMIDFRKGRSGDWRRAPADWSVYHPDHDDYQVPGRCRRWIGRCLNVLSRIGSIDQTEMDKAFARAATGRPTLVGVTGHDYRDLGVEVEHVMDLLANSAARYPGVKFKYCDALDGFRRATRADPAATPLDLDIRLERSPADDVPHLAIRAAAGQVFGPQPYLAIETMSRRFIHDNLDFDLAPGQWFYAFHADTLPIADVRRIGVAANDAYGNTCTRVIEVNA